MQPVPRMPGALPRYHEDLQTVNESMICDKSVLAKLEAKHWDNFLKKEQVSN